MLNAFEGSVRIGKDGNSSAVALDTLHVARCDNDPRGMVRDPATGAIEGDAARFPEGMPAFIARIHALGFKFGLYTDIGRAGCHKPFVGSWPDYQRDADTFAKWQVDYVKFDSCDMPRGFSAEDLCYIERLRCLEATSYTTEAKLACLKALKQ